MLVKLAPASVRSNERWIIPLDVVSLNQPGSVRKDAEMSTGVSPLSSAGQPPSGGTFCLSSAPLDRLSASRWRPSASAYRDGPREPQRLAPPIANLSAVFFLQYVWSCEPRFLRQGCTPLTRRTIVITSDSSRRVPHPFGLRQPLITETSDASRHVPHSFGLCQLPLRRQIPALATVHPPQKASRIAQVCGSCVNRDTARKLWDGKSRTVISTPGRNTSTSASLRSRIQTLIDS